MNDRIRAEEEAEWANITSKLDRVLIDSDNLPLLVARLRKDMYVAKDDLAKLEPRTRALEVNDQTRFTKNAAEDLFKDLFRADMAERAALARLVKLIYIPLGLLAAAALIEVVRGFFK
jgi:hypothetical protein